LIENMTRVSVYAFKQVIVSFLKEFCYSWSFRTTVTKFSCCGEQMHQDEQSAENEVKPCKCILDVMIVLRAFRESKIE